MFEEPEVSLHPSAISDLATDLRNFASSPNNQVIATTHSSQLVSEDIMDLNSVIKVDRDGTKTQVFQNKIPDSDLSSAKNLVYFDRPRSDMFFARKVVLMEGPTEYALYNYLRRTGALPQNISQNVTVIDCVGKSINAPKFVIVFTVPSTIAPTLSAIKYFLSDLFLR